MSSLQPETEEALTPIKFHFYKINFTPYNHANDQTSRSIIHKVMTFLSQQQVEGKGLLIDKHEERGNDGARPLFVTSTSFMLKEKRVRGSIALLRTGKIPLVKPADKFLLIPFDSSNGQIAEQTHFFIDYSTDSVVLCVEFNYNGPRLSDIEYYFRIVARDKLKLAKATEAELYMNTSIDKTLAELKNVLNFDIKIQPQKLAQLDTALVGQYFTGITSLGSRIKPKFIKLEAMFQTPGKLYVSSEIIKEANSMATQLLKAFKARPTNMDAFENFVIKYEDQEGKEEFFNLLKGKKEVIKHVNIKTLKARQWYELIESDLNEFVQSL
jgi:hypothetical protein